MDKSALRQRVLEAQYPRRARATFFSDPEHNPWILADCAVCGGRGQRCDESNGTAVIDECQHCAGRGSSGRVARYFERATNDFRVAHSTDEWLRCPWCERRFCLRDGAVWSGLRHLKCGGLVITTSVESWRRLHAEVWRDGGSYSITLARGAQLISLWLAAPRELGSKQYGKLFASRGSDATLKECRVPPLGEGDWQRAIEVAERARDSASDERALEFGMLLKARSGAR